MDGVSIGLMIMLLSLTLGFAESTAAEVEILQSAATRSCPETRELVDPADACTALTHFVSIEVSWFGVSFLSLRFEATNLRPNPTLYRPLS